MDDIALCEHAEAFNRPGALNPINPENVAALLGTVSELVDRFRPYAQAPDAYPFPTHEEEPTL
jgi:hypothetical protein